MIFNYKLKSTTLQLRQFCFITSQTTAMLAASENESYMGGPPPRISSISQRSSKLCLRMEDVDDFEFHNPLASGIEDDKASQPFFVNINKNLLGKGSTLRRLKKIVWLSGTVTVNPDEKEITLEYEVVSKSISKATRKLVFARGEKTPLLKLVQVRGRANVLSVDSLVASDAETTRFMISFENEKAQQEFVTLIESWMLDITPVGLETKEQQVSLQLSH